MRRLDGIRTLIWDCDGTIWKHVEYGDEIVTKELGIPLTEKFSDEYFKMIENIDSHFEHQKVTKTAYVDLIQKYMPVLSENGIKAEEFFDEWMRIETSELNEGARETIQYFYSKGYKNIVLTDMPYVKQVSLLEKYGILQYLQEVHTGDDNYLKRHPKSSKRIIQSGHEKEYVIIGDALKNDIAFANNTGIRSIWFNPQCKKNKSKEYKPTMQVTSLYEVCQRIKW